MNNNEIEQIKQFLHSEICERRDYSASKMCEEVLKFIAHLSEEKNDRMGMKGMMTMNNNPGNLNMTVLRDKLDMALDKETADSLNEWLNNKRNMTDEQMAMMQLVSVLDDIQSMMHELVLDERNELIDELTQLYERYNVYAQSRNGDKS